MELFISFICELSITHRNWWSLIRSGSFKDVKNGCSEEKIFSIFIFNSCSMKEILTLHLPLHQVEWGVVGPSSLL